MQNQKASRKYGQSIKSALKMWKTAWGLDGFGASEFISLSFEQLKWKKILFVKQIARKYWGKTSRSAVKVPWMIAKKLHDDSLDCCERKKSEKSLNYRIFNCKCCFVLEEETIFQCIWERKVPSEGEKVWMSLKLQLKSLSVTLSFSHLR